MKISVKNQPKEITDEMAKIVAYLETLGYKGKIKFKLEQRKAKTNLSLFDKWERYLAEADFNEPESYISEWSPNNGSEIGTKMTNNQLLRLIINRWYNDFNRYETENMIDTLYWFFNEFEYYRESLNYDDSTLINFILENEFEDVLKKITSFADSKLKKDFIEVIELFLDRNPRFKNDW